MQRPQVLHLASWYPSTSHPTLGNFVQRHIEAIEEGKDTMVLFAAESNKESIDYQPEGRPGHIIVYYNKHSPLISHYRALRKGYHYLLEQGYAFNLVHVHVSFPAGLLALALNLPYIVTEHFSGYQKQRNYKWGLLKKLLARRILNQAKVVCPVSSQLGGALREFGVSSTLKVISNVVDTRIFYPASKPVRNQKFRFLHISSLQNSTKNITGILSAFAKLSKLNPNFELAIGGDGDTEWLRQAARQAGLSEKNVAILSSMSPLEVAQQMRQADCFVLFSNIENQPVVLLEALCCGVPVIATRVGGIEEFVTPERGLLVQPQQEDTLIQACEKMLGGFTLDAQKVAKEMQTLCSPAAVRKQYREIYANVLPSNS